MRRFYNGALDVGAYEYDWRPDYRAVLGNSSHLALLEASPYVVRSAGGTSMDIPDDAVLQCVLTTTPDSVPFMCVVEAETILTDPSLFMYSFPTICNPSVGLYGNSNLPFLY